MIGKTKVTISKSITLPLEEILDDVQLKYLSEEDNIIEALKRDYSQSLDDAIDFMADTEVCLS